MLITPNRSFYLQAFWILLYLHACVCVLLYDSLRHSPSTQSAKSYKIMSLVYEENSIKDKTNIMKFFNQAGSIILKIRCDI